MASFYDEQILGARQQAETARKLREMALQENPQGQMISGHYVAPSWILVAHLNQTLHRTMHLNLVNLTHLLRKH